MAAALAEAVVRHAGHRRQRLIQQRAGLDVRNILVDIVKQRIGVFQRVEARQRQLDFGLLADAAGEGERAGVHAQHRVLRLMCADDARYRRGIVALQQHIVAAPVRFQNPGQRKRLRIEERGFKPGARADQLAARAAVSGGVAGGRIHGEGGAEHRLAGAYPLAAAADGLNQRGDGAGLAGLADADDGDDLHSDASVCCSWVMALQTPLLYLIGG